MCDFFPDWDDIALAGAMAEEMAEEKRERDAEMGFDVETDEDEK